MPSRYKHEDGYRKYQSFSLREEFGELEEYLLLDEENRNDEMFALVDEIYHWFCVKQLEVEELLGMNDIKACDFCGAVEAEDCQIQAARSLNVSIGTFRKGCRDISANICEHCAERILEDSMRHVIGRMRDSIG